LYVSKRAAVLLNKPYKECNIITLHIGNGVSIAAIKNGISIDTSMGFTPLEGAVMGTRSGDVDPAIIPFICKMENKTPEQVESILNKSGGLKGITKKYKRQNSLLI
jgi:acetate kinase